jgi:LPS export ABC transporter protein LptC
MDFISLKCYNIITMTDFTKVIILLLIFIVFIITALLINRPGSPISDSTITCDELKTEESILMKDINYQEIKGSRTLYKISAETGKFSFSNGEGTIENINGEIYFSEDKAMLIKGNHGRVTENGNIVILEDNVLGTMDDGTEFTSESMSYLVRDNTILSERPVSLRNKTGTISASSMKVNLKDDTIRFSGNVDAIIKKFLSR